jgi:hypothetical protein
MEARGACEPALETRPASATTSPSKGRRNGKRITQYKRLRKKTLEQLSSLKETRIAIEVERGARRMRCCGKESSREGRCCLNGSWERLERDRVQAEGEIQCDFAQVREHQGRRGE